MFSGNSCGFLKSQVIIRDSDEFFDEYWNIPTNIIRKYTSHRKSQADGILKLIFPPQRTEKIWELSFNDILGTQIKYKEKHESEKLRT